MQPIQDLFNRIRWDTEFSNGKFSIGYLDRIEGRIIRVSFEELRFDDSTPFRFQIIDSVGTMRSIPFHRVKEVYKDGALIWHRPL